VVAGTSAGALVGAAYALDRLDDLERWLDHLAPRDVVGYFDIGGDGGFLKGRKLFDFFAQHVEDRPIESLALPFGAVATDLANGHEIWLRHGSLLAAVRASVSIPGMLAPVRHEGRWCIDGGLVNPVPVTLCRALGADVVIAVDVNDGLLEVERPLPPAVETDGDAPASPNVLEVLERSLHIAQAGLTRARLALDPPEILIAPRVGQIGFLEFHRAADCFDAGRQAVQAMAAELTVRLGERAAVTSSTGAADRSVPAGGAPPSGSAAPA
jgi:NTE family protein